MPKRRLKLWGWGYEDEGPDPGWVRFVSEALRQRFKLGELRVCPPPRVEELPMLSALSLLSADLGETARFFAAEAIGFRQDETLERLHLAASEANGVLLEFLSV